MTCVEWDVKHYYTIPFAYSLCNFYGAVMMIKGSLLLNAPIVKHFQAKKVPFWAKI